MKLQVRPSRDGQWFVRLVGRNGRVLLTSETYTRKASAERLASKIAQLLVQEHTQYAVGLMKRIGPGSPKS